MPPLDGRRFFGKGTTAKKVIESDLTHDDYLRMVREANKGYEDLGVLVG